MRHRPRSFAVALAVLAAACTGPAATRAGDWPAGTVPGPDPVWLAPGLVTTGLTTRDLTMTPDMDEFYYCAATAGYAQAVICVIRRTPGGWSEPQAASFSGDPRWIDLEPSVAPDGRHLYFVSTRNAAQDGAGDADLWRVERQGDHWGEARRLDEPVNSPLLEYFPSLTADGTLYFTRADSTGRVHAIWRARPAAAGGFLAPQLLPPQVNAGSNRFNAWVAPDESHLILSVIGLEQNHGLADYWRVDRSPDDTWQAARNLGARINAGLGRAWSAMVTPDGKAFCYMAAPAADDGWPRRWGQLQARAATPGATGGIAVIALEALAAEGPGTAALAGPVSRRPFPEVSGPWLGQELPGSEPVLFAPGLLSTGLNERDVLVHPGGREIWYGLMDQGLFTIMATTLENDRWSEPLSVPFHTDPDFVCFEPTLAADGSRVLFLSNRAAPGQEQGRGWANQNIFASLRQADGWSPAEALPPPVTTDAAEYFPSLAADGTLYFTREDETGAAIWSAEPAGQGYAPPQRLPATVNLSGQVYNATVAADEGWLIACVGGHEQNLGPADYWISFADGRGVWLPAVNLGPRFNGPGERAASASLSPDGRVLFFSSSRIVADAAAGGPVTPGLLRQRQGSPGTGSSDLWWVDAKVLAEYQP